jgi:hypothetical protein
LGQRDQHGADDDRQHAEGLGLLKPRDVCVSGSSAPSLELTSPASCTWPLGTITLMRRDEELAVKSCKFVFMGRPAR